MKFDEIMGVIAELAKSQGFYGRLLDAIAELEGDAYDELVEVLEAQGFGDALDVVMYFEC